MTDKQLLIDPLTTNDDEILRRLVVHQDKLLIRLDEEISRLKFQVACLERNKEDKKPLGVG